MVLLSEDTESISNLKDALSEIDENWYLGMDSEYKWRNAVLQEIPYLFCVSSVDTSVETGNSRRIDGHTIIIVLSFFCNYNDNFDALLDSLYSRAARNIIQIAFVNSKE